jgi:hypothetical protein
MVWLARFKKQVLDTPLNRNAASASVTIGGYRNHDSVKS